MWLCGFERQLPARRRRSKLVSCDHVGGDNGFDGAVIAPAVSGLRLRWNIAGAVADQVHAGVADFGHLAGTTRALPWT